KRFCEKLKHIVSSPLQAKIQTMAVGSKRILVLIGILLIKSPLSPLSYYGNLLPYLASYYYARRDEIFMHVDPLWPPSIYRCIYTLTMIFTSPLELRFGLCSCIVAGLLLLWTSIMCCFFAVQGPLAFVSIFGVTHGIAVGILYPTTLKILLQTMPQKAGFIAGLLDSGPVLGSLANIGLSFFVINPGNSKPDLHVDNKVLFSDPNVIHRVPYFFLIAGAVMIAYTAVGLILNKCDNTNYHSILSHDDSDVTPDEESQTCDDQSQCVDKSTKLVVQAELCPREAIRTGKFWCVWLCFICTSHTSHLHMNLYKQYGQLVIRSDSVLVGAGILSMLGTVFARPCIGLFSDKFGIRKTTLAISVLSSIFMFMMVISNNRHSWVYVILVVMEFVCISPQTLVFGLLTTFEFGKTHCASNFGLACSGNLMIMLLEPFFASSVIGAFGWDWLFLTGAI
ncbi:hypothetical protein EGW08_021249, partial [Elysia chlorotica]